MSRLPTVRLRRNREFMREIIVNVHEYALHMNRYLAKGYRLVGEERGNATDAQMRGQIRDAEIEIVRERTREEPKNFAARAITVRPAATAAAPLAGAPVDGAADTGPAPSTVEPSEPSIPPATIPPEPMIPIVQGPYFPPGAEAAAEAEADAEGDQIPNQQADVPLDNSTAEVHGPARRPALVARSRRAASAPAPADDTAAAETP